MDDHLAALPTDEHDHLEEIGGSVWTDDEPPVGVVSEIFDDERVFEGTKHVFVADPVAAGRGMDLHTLLLYYEIS